MLGHTPLKTDYNRFMDQIQPFRNLIHVSKNEIRNSTTIEAGGIYLRTVEV